MGLRWHYVTTYPSPEGSCRWTSFLVGWPTDGPLGELNLMSFPMGLALWVQIPDTFLVELGVEQAAKHLAPLLPPLLAVLLVSNSSQVEYSSLFFNQHQMRGEHGMGDKAEYSSLFFNQHQMRGEHGMGDKAEANDGNSPPPMCLFIALPKIGSHAPGTVAISSHHLPLPLRLG
jgi:hypothetical protein